MQVGWFERVANHAKPSSRLSQIVHRTSYIVHGQPLSATASRSFVTTSDHGFGTSRPPRLCIPAQRARTFRIVNRKWQQSACQLGVSLLKVSHVPQQRIHFAPMSFPFFSKLRHHKQHLRLIKGEMQRVREKIAAQSTNFQPHVRGYMAQLCMGRGKMIRPGLVLLTAAATGGIKDEHISFAALLEMLHMASLVHDDVLDKAEVRRDRPTPNALWGNELAVLLGDTLLAQAMVLGTRIGDLRFNQRMAVCTRDLCEGEVEQSTRLWDAAMTRAEYYEIIRKKTATLFAMAMSGAAMLQGMEDEMVEHLNRMGTLLGISYQIYDDCLDLLGVDEQAGKTLGTDVQKGKLTLPIFFLMESDNEDIAAEVRDAVENRSGFDLKRLRQTESFHVALQLSANEALSRNEEAREVLWCLPETPAREALAETTYRLDEMLQDCCDRTLIFS